MKINDPAAIPSYTITQVLPSRGLAAVARDGDGMLLDFYGENTSTAVRVGVYITDAQGMLAELRKIVDFLSQAVVAPPPNSLN